MKLLTSALALATAAMASGCATYYDRPAQVAYVPAGTAIAVPAANPTVPVAEGNNSAMPYTANSMFFKDRGLHQEVPGALTPKLVEPVPRG
jgi:hypothetical protein